MEHLARAGRNMAFKGLGELVARAAFFALFFYAARALGPADFGLYAYANSLAALAAVGADLGLHTLLVSEGARAPRLVGPYAGTMLVIKLGLCALVLAGLAGYQHWAGGEPRALWLVLAVGLAQCLWSVVELSVAGLNALERMNLEAVVRGTGRLAALLLAGGLMWWGWGLWGLALGILGANLLAALLGLSLLGRLASFHPRLDPAFLGGLIRRALPLALTGVFILVYFRVDIIMLELLGRGYAEIGQYAAVVKIIDAVGMVPGLVAGAALPVLASLHAGRPAELPALHGQVRRLVIYLGLPAAAGLWVVRYQVPALLFGPEFAPAGRALAWLAPALVFLFINHLQLATLTAQGRQGRAAVATGVCVLVNLGLNLIMIPRWGMVGAAAATLGTEATLWVLCAAFLGQRLGMGLVATVWRPALAAGAMLIALAPGVLPLGVALPLGAGLYALGLWGFGALGPADLAALARLVRGLPGARP